MLYFWKFFAEEWNLLFHGDALFDELLEEFAAFGVVADLETEYHFFDIPESFSS